MTIQELVDEMSLDMIRGMHLVGGQAHYRGIAITTVQRGNSEPRVVIRWSECGHGGDPGEYEMGGDYPSRFRAQCKAWESDWALHKQCFSP